MPGQGKSTNQPFFNRIMTGVLQSPLHGLVSKTIMLITFTGRKSGKRYTTPISYLRDGDLVTAYSRANWWSNLKGGAPVTLRIKNKEYRGQADVVVDDKEAAARGLQVFLRSVRLDARFHKVRFEEDGDPNWDDVQRAAQSLVMLRIQLQQ